MRRTPQVRRTSIRSVTTRPNLNMFCELGCLSLTQFLIEKIRPWSDTKPSRHQLNGGNDLVKKFFRDCSRLIRSGRIHVSADQVNTPVE